MENEFLQIKIRVKKDLCLKVFKFSKGSYTLQYNLILKDKFWPRFKRVLANYLGNWKARYFWIFSQNFQATWAITAYELCLSLTCCLHMLLSQLKRNKKEHFVKFLMTPWLQIFGMLKKLYLNSGKWVFTD